MPENSPPKKSAPWSALGAASVIGLHMVTAPAVGTVLGWLCDRWLGSWPIGAGVGFVLGVLAGFRMVFEEAKILQPDPKERETRPGERDIYAGPAVPPGGGVGQTGGDRK